MRAMVSIFLLVLALATPSFLLAQTMDDDSTPQLAIVRPTPGQTFPAGPVDVEVVTAGFYIPEDGSVVLWLDVLSSDADRATMVVERTVSVLPNVSPGKHTLYVGLLKEGSKETSAVRASVDFTVEPPPPTLPPQTRAFGTLTGLWNHPLLRSSALLIGVLSVVVVGILAVLYKIISQGDRSEQEGSEGTQTPPIE
ncbi:MAG: hypothetical protein Q8R11_00940 [bacterium]|nr:hypothetical protein [bacterium]